MSRVGCFRCIPLRLASKVSSASLKRCSKNESRLNNRSAAASEIHRFFLITWKLYSVNVIRIYSVWQLEISDGLADRTKWRDTRYLSSLQRSNATRDQFCFNFDTVCAALPILFFSEVTSNRCGVESKGQLQRCNEDEEEGMCTWRCQSAPMLPTS